MFTTQSVNALSSSPNCARGKKFLTTSKFTSTLRPSIKVPGYGTFQSPGVRIFASPGASDAFGRGYGSLNPGLLPRTHVSSSHDTCVFYPGHTCLLAVLLIHHIKNKIENNHQLKKYKWQKPHQSNLTGTDKAYHPSKNKDIVKKKYNVWKI